MLLPLSTSELFLLLYVNTPVWLFFSTQWDVNCSDILKRTLVPSTRRATDSNRQHEKHLCALYRWINWTREQSLCMYPYNYRRERLHAGANHLKSAMLLPPLLSWRGIMVYLMTMVIKTIRKSGGKIKKICIWIYIFVHEAQQISFRTDNLASPLNCR